jgi:hypothetical protein
MALGRAASYLTFLNLVCLIVVTAYLLVVSLFPFCGEYGCGIIMCKVDFKLIPFLMLDWVNCVAASMTGDTLLGGWKCGSTDFHSGTTTSMLQLIVTCFIIQAMDKNYTHGSSQMHLT